MNKDKNKNQTHGKGNKPSPDYETYPSSEDIYSRDIEENLNPEDLSEIKEPGTGPGNHNEKGPNEDLFGADLDVPGSELDDKEEDVGNEDEENNLYSPAGDKD